MTEDDLEHMTVSELVTLQIRLTMELVGRAAEAEVKQNLAKEWAKMQHGGGGGP